jgi:hypothetical protein
MSNPLGNDFLASDGLPKQPAAAASQKPREPQRLAGAPLPMGSRGGVRPAAGALGRTPPAAHSPAEGFVNLLKNALPLAQKLLPLLDGQIGSVVSNVLAQRPRTQPAQPAAPPAPPPPPVDLEPIETGLAELRGQHRELCGQIIEQNTSLKRCEDQLEMVREATDRNTLEQQELLEDLKSVGRKINLFVWLALALLAFSIGLNVVLYLHILRVLP